MPIITTAVALSFSNWLIEKTGDKLFDKITDIKTEQSSIDKKFLLAFEKTALEAQEKYPDIFGGDLKSYFLSENIYSEVYKLLFKKSKINVDEIIYKIDNNTLPKDFVEIFIEKLKENCLLDIDLNNLLSDNQIYIAIIGLGENVETIKNNTQLSLEEISEIKTLLELTFNKKFSIDHFLENYKKAALKNLSEINFIGLGIKSHFKKNRKKLFDIYVHPIFRLNKKESEKLLQTEFTAIDEEFEFDEEYEEYDYNEDETINISKVFDYDSNLVILGQPGSGKSVLVKYLICQILNQNISIIKSTQILERIPFRIELRRYLQHKREHKQGIIKYLAKSFETEFGLLNLTDDNVIKIFEQKKVIIFFDGLDEIFNSKDKIDIRNDIEVLLDLYPNILSFITSRFIGYDEAKLSNDKFIELKILNFNETQVREYVRRWYEHEEVSEENREKEVKEFIKIKSSIDVELITNPLFLSLIVILFRNNLKLPESKLEIYQSCTKTLVDKWDQEKVDLNIELNEELLKRKETLFANLAFWQYKLLSEQAKIITNALASKEVAECIIHKLKLTDDWITAEVLADNFMNYALKRSLYFDNNFTHKTFLEYYTAYWIYSNVEKKLKKEDRNNIIAKYITNSYWYIVLELLINMIDQDQADNEIIDELLTEQVSNNVEALNFFLVVAQSIKNLSSRVVVSLLITTINNLITNSKRSNLAFRRRLYQSLVSYLKNAPNESLFIQAYQDFFKAKLIESSFRNLVILYMEICSQNDIKTVSFNIKIIQQKERLLEIRDKDPLVFLSTNQYYGMESQNAVDLLTFFIKKFGESSIYKEISGLYEDYQFINQLEVYLSWQLREQNFSTFEENINNLFHQGLSKRNLIHKFRIDHMNYFYERNFAFKEIITYVFVSKDNYLKMLCILILWKYLNSHYNRGIYSIDDIPNDNNIDLKELISNNTLNNLYDVLSDQLNLEMFTS